MELITTRGQERSMELSQPVYIERPRWKIWPFILGAVVLLFIGFHELDRQAAVRAAAGKESFMSDWNSGALNNAAAFTARCGQPRLIESDGVLHYNSGSVGDYLVTFGAAPSLQLEHVHVRHGKAETTTTRVWPDAAFTALACR
jgi:hypothetical protein